VVPDNSRTLVSQNVQLYCHLFVVVRYPGFEYFVQPRASQVDLLVRARHDRSLADESHRLFLTVSNSPVRGKVQVEVGRRPNQPSRIAECQVQFKRVKLRPPKNRPANWPKLEPIILWAILIQEIHPPAGVDQAGPHIDV